MNPTKVKDILVTCKDTRLSELAMEIDDQDQLREQTQMVQEMCLDLRKEGNSMSEIFLYV